MMDLFIKYSFCKKPTHFFVAKIVFFFLPVRWASLLPSELKEVVSEEDGHLIVLQQLAAFGMFTVAAVEDVERAVVSRALHVLHVILHLHFHRVAVVVFAALELLVAVFALETLQGPFLPAGPRLLAVEQNYGFIGLLESLDELFWT